MQNKIVVHFLDGNIMKGFTDNFFPNKSLFHVRDKDNGAATEVNLLRLKGIFFVKNFDGNRNYQERTDTERTGIGKKIQIHFKDGEIFIGYTSGYSPERNGFFAFPSDAGSNTERVFVLKNATEDIRFI